MIWKMNWGLNLHSTKDRSIEKIKGSFCVNKLCLASTIVLDYKLSYQIKKFISLKLNTWISNGNTLQMTPNKTKCMLIMYYKTQCFNFNDGSQGFGNILPLHWHQCLQELFSISETNISWSIIWCIIMFLSYSTHTSTKQSRGGRINL